VHSDVCSAASSAVMTVALTDDSKAAKMAATKVYVSVDHSAASLAV